MNGPAGILDRARRALAFALRQAIALLAPRRIILGGGVSLIGEAHWFEPIRRLVDAEVFAPFRGSYDIVPAALGEEVVVHGALALAHDAACGSRLMRAGAAGMERSPDAHEWQAEASRSWAAVAWCSCKD